MVEFLHPKNWTGARKLIAYFGALVVVLVLGILGRMDSGALSFVITGIVSAFVAGNAAVHIAGNGSGTGKTDR